MTHTAESEHLHHNDVTLRWDFPNVKSGDYVVRFVVREPKTGATTVINRTLKVL